MKIAKAWAIFADINSEEYTTRHEKVVAAKREAQRLREMEEMKRGC